MRSVTQSRQLDAADTNGIAVFQSADAGVNLNLNGVFVSGGVATLDVQRQVALNSTLNISAATFTITGTDDQGHTISETLVGPNAGSVASILNYLTVTQISADIDIGTPATGALTLVVAVPSAGETVTLGGQTYTWVAALTGADDVLIGGTIDASRDNLVAAINNAAGEGTTYGTGTLQNTSALAAAGGAGVLNATALIPGTAGNSIVSTETMANGSWGGATLSGGLDDGVQAGTNGVGASAPIPVDVYLTPTNIGLGLVLTGTVNVTVQHTFDDIWDLSAALTWFDHPTLAAETANADGNLAFPPRAVRLLTNSGVGTAILTLVQAGAAA